MADDLARWQAGLDGRPRRHDPHLPGRQPLLLPRRRAVQPGRTGRSAAPGPAARRRPPRLADQHGSRLVLTGDDHGGTVTAGLSQLDVGEPRPWAACRLAHVENCPVGFGLEEIAPRRNNEPRNVRSVTPAQLNCLANSGGPRSSDKETGMARFRRPIALAVGVVSLTAVGLGPLAFTSGVAVASASAGGKCSAGAHTLAAPGSRLYPETGNGGYRSVHTDVHLVYDAGTNTFLPGNSVALTDQATQCLTSFSLDFERSSANTTAGPDLSVKSVTVNGGRPNSRSSSPRIRATPTARAIPTRGRTRRRRPIRSAARTATRSRRLHPGAQRLPGRRRPRRHPVPGQQAGRHAQLPGPGRHQVHGPGQLHRPARRAQRR